MSRSSIDGLLQPSLSQHQPKKPMYSVTSHALVAFFGGPIALVLFSGLSIRHIGLLKQHLVYYVLLLIGALGATFFLSFLMVTGWPEWLAIGSKASSSFKLTNRVLALALFGVIYLFQRHYFSISNLHKEDSNPWIPAIGAGVIGFGIQFGVIVLAGTLAR